MKNAFTLAVAFSLSALAQAEAKVLLINPGNQTGTSTFAGYTTPYTVPLTSTWNNGGGSNYSGLQYADGTSATGVSIVADAHQISFSGGVGTGSLDFNNPTVSTLQGDLTSSGVFNVDPAEDAIYFSSDSEADGILAMRIAGLANGIYDVYVAAAYVGGTAARRPGTGNDVAHQGVWVFTGSTANSLAYSGSGTSGGALTGAGATSLTASQILDNSVNSAWTKDTNYALLRVTISNANPTLYIASSGAAAVVGATSGEDRPWLNLVQVVAVPEPSSALLALGGLGCLALRRRR